MIGHLELNSNSSDKITQSSTSSPKIEKSPSSEIVQVIHNREQAELLFVNELKLAKSEVLIASSSLSYLKRLDGLGLLDFLEQAKSREVDVLILCPEPYSNIERGDGDAAMAAEAAAPDSGQQLLQDLKKYAQVRGVSGQIKGSMILTDNSRVLSISDESINAFTIYSDNNSFVNNFGSLFETLWIQKDILNDLVQSRDSLQKSNEKLRRHDAMQKEFINIAAHELRTPVQPLLVIAEQIRKDLGGKDEVTISKKRIEILVRNIKKLERLTADILDVSRIESKSLVLSKEVFDLRRKVEEAIADVQTMMPAKHIIPIRHISSELSAVMVNADASKISQAIINLLRNAIKFTHNESDDSTIELELDVNIKSREAIVAIRDRGPGIDLSIEPRLFTKFSSMGPQEGTGLGLYIAKAIVESHGGRIWGENNKDGKGATFGFTLPLAE